MHTSLQQRVLAELDIDIWVRRGAAPSESAPEDDSQTNDGSREQPAVSVELPGAPALSPEGAVPLEIRCLSMSPALVIGELALEDDRRLARDVLRAAAGFPERQPGSSTFRWPQTSRGDQGPAAARSALNAFLRGQIERGAVARVVVLGETTGELLFPGLQGDDQLTDFGGARCLVSGSARDLRASSQRKRSLWQAMLTM